MSRRGILCLLAACGGPSSAVSNRSSVEQSWFARRIIVTNVDSWVLDYTLQRHDADRASLTIVARKVASPDAQPDWRAAVVKQELYAGTVAGDIFDLEVPDGERALEKYPASEVVGVPRHTPGRRLRLRCIPGKRDVAPTHALRLPGGRSPVPDECINLGTWSLLTQATSALMCSDVDATPSRYNDVVFGRPGIEHVVYSDDGCDRFGEGLRMMTADRELHPFFKL